MNENSLNVPVADSPAKFRNRGRLVFIAGVAYPLFPTSDLIQLLARKIRLEAIGKLKTK